MKQISYRERRPSSSRWNWALWVRAVDLLALLRRKIAFDDPLRYQRVDWRVDLVTRIPVQAVEAVVAVSTRSTGATVAGSDLS